MQVFVVLQASYPNGLATTQRVHNYARALRSAGLQSSVLLPFPTERDDIRMGNSSAQGEYQGVPFQYMCGTTGRPFSVIGRAWRDLAGLVRLWSHLMWKGRRGDAVIICSNAMRVIIPAWIAGRTKGIRVVFEKTEYPFYGSLVARGPRGVYQRLYVRTVYRLCDSMFVISDALRSYFQSIVRRNCTILTLPAMVDIDEISGEGNVEPPVPGPYIMLCGKLSQSQAGVLDLLRAFSQVVEVRTDVRLLLAGTAGSADREQIRQTIADLGLAESVEWLGYLERDKLIGFMRMATILVLPKPANLQADYCFPSKVAEYLATGAPAVVTRCPAVERYLRDRETAFLCEPGNPDELAESFLWVLRNRNEAHKVGKAGRKLAEREFDYRALGKRLADFLREGSGPITSRRHFSHQR